MHIFSQTGRWPITILALLCAVGVHQTAFAQVLCIGEDGHVEVEYASADCCGDAGESSRRDCEPLFNTEDEDCRDRCGACVDVPLGTNGRVASTQGSVDRSETPLHDAAVVSPSTSAFSATPPANISVPLIL
jgi:hypothetical protein